MIRPYKSATDGDASLKKEKMGWLVEWKRTVVIDGYAQETSHDQERDTHWDAIDLRDELENDKAVYDITISEL